MNADILRITDPIISDESISEYEHLEYNCGDKLKRWWGYYDYYRITRYFYPPERKLPSYRGGTIKE